MRLIVTILLLAPLAQVVADGDFESMPGLDVASRAYAAEDYEQVIEVLGDVLDEQPECAECAHLLGKAYGRLAEHASWLSAMSLAKKSRVALENAVAIDPFNDEALADLIEFYRMAPGFLGGDDEKADELDRRLRALRSEHSS